MALLSALLVWMAQDGYKEELQREAEKAEALRMDAPAPVAIDAFTTADVHLAEEVHVTTWINTDHNYELTKTRKGTDTVRRMFVLFGPGDTSETKVARGVVVLHPVDVDAFLEQVLSTADVTDPRFVFSLLGKRVRSPDLSDMVDEAFEERDLSKDSDFLVIEPYLEGRAAALAPDPEAPRRVATIFGMLGAISALITLGKLRGKAQARRRAKAEPSLADGIIPPPAMAALRPQPQAAKPAQGYGTLPTPAPANAWSPLAAVMAKQAALDPASVTKGYVAPAARFEPAAAAPVNLPRKGLAKVRSLALALVLYLALYLSLGTGNGPFSTASVQQMIPAVTAALAQTGWLPGGFGTKPDPAAAPPAPVLASLPDASQSGAQDMAARAAAERAGIVVRADGPLPEPPATPAAPKQTIPVSAAPEVVEPDGMPRIDSLTDGLRGVLFQGSIALSAFLLTMALGLHLTRRNRKRPAALPDRDPWDRLSERLR
jgi:hypothetical protein